VNTPLGKEQEAFDVFERGEEIPQVFWPILPSGRGRPDDRALRAARLF
jgi:hypothetical protein